MNYLSNQLVRCRNLMKMHMSIFTFSNTTGTILMTDIAGGKTLENMIGKMVADLAWGLTDFEAKTWTPVTDELHQKPPPEHADNPALQKYAEFLEVVYPREEVKDDSTLDSDEFCSLRGLGFCP